jgi:hypothetical protein
LNAIFPAPSPVTSPSLVAGATEVYVCDANSSSIYSFAVGALFGSPTTIPSTATEMVSNGAELFFVQSMSAIDECQLPAGQPTTFKVPSTPAVSLTLGSSGVFWTDQGGNLNEALFDGGPAVNGGYVLSSLAPNADGLAVDATRVYWANSQSGEILTFVLGSFVPTPTTVATGQGQVFSVAAANGTVYWAAPGPGEIRSAQMTPDGGMVDGGTIQSLATGQSSPAAVLLDSSYIYWVNTGPTGVNDGGSVMRALLDGGNPTVIAAGQYLPQIVAVNANYIYWINGDGTLWQATPK